MENSIDFKVWGKFALFTDPITKIGGEKCSYHIPTYEALKGIARSIYWKPTFIWVIDRVRIMKGIRTQIKGIKPLEYGGGNSLALYYYLSNVEYQVRAHFEWNEHLPELKHDRNDGKHYSIAKRMLERGGRRDIFLGTRECQGYAEPCCFGEECGDFDKAGELCFELMFHSFSYPEESGVNELRSCFWKPSMIDGIIEFPRPEKCEISKFVREMLPKKFIPNVNFSISQEGELLA
jgi:CRISPR-associated protein Cas5d